VPVGKSKEPTQTRLYLGIMREYLAAHPMMAPKVEGRATATDAPSTLLSQLEGYNYTFI
jgi:sulfur-oxidizing protein SoxB